MSSFRAIALDGRTIADLRELVAVLPETCALDQIFEVGMRLLEGRGDAVSLLEQLEASPNMNEASVEALRPLAKSISIFLWDCGKAVTGGTRDMPADRLEELLVKGGLEASFANSFCQFFVSQRRRLVEVKRSMALSSQSYHEFAWRLDIELSKRSLTVTTEPKYQLRLDVASSGSGGNKNNANQDTVSCERRRDYTTCTGQLANGDIITSFHLEADYANMKNLQLELERALEELEGVHGQRLTRYIS